MSWYATTQVTDGSIACWCCCSGEAGAPGNHVHSPCALTHAGCVHNCSLASCSNQGPFATAGSAWTCLPPMTAGCMLTFNSSAGQSPERRGTRCRMICPADDVANWHAQGPLGPTPGDRAICHLASHTWPLIYAQAAIPACTHFSRHHNAGNHPSRGSDAAASRDQLAARQRQCSKTDPWQDAGCPDSVPSPPRCGSRVGPAEQARLRGLRRQEGQLCSLQVRQAYQGLDRRCWRCPGPGQVVR